MSKLMTLKAETFKRLSAVSISFRDGVTEIRGRNSHGKSSVIDAFVAAIGGRKCEPDLPIKVGEEQAKVTLETSDLLVKKVWTAGDEGKINVRLEVIDKATKGKLPSPQTVLDKLFGAQAEDPLAFMLLKPRDQAAKLRQIAGLDTEVLDQERDVVFAQRTGVNRELATLKGKLDGLEEPAPPPELEAEIDVSDFLLKLEQAGKTQAKNDLCRREVRTIAAALEEKLADLQLLTAQIDGLRERLAKGNEVISAFKDPDVADIKRQADAAKVHNARVRAQQERRAEIERRIDAYAALKQQLAEADRLARHQTARIQEIDQAKAKLLAEAKFPVPGLGVDGDTVTLNGIPFDQASQSQVIRTCFAIALAGSGELRAIYSKHGSLLDEQSRVEVAGWAEENDVQVLLEVVGDGPGGIVIEDGQVKP